MTLTEALKETDALLEKIKGLQSENNQFADIGKLYSEIKTEAIKEFAERLKEKAHTVDDDYSPNGEITYVEVDDINNLVKEMEGDAE